MRLCFDSYNISLVKGTGVATYGRSLVQAAVDLGHLAQVLFGIDAARSAVPLLNEISISDLNQASVVGKDSWSRLRRGWRAASGLGLRRAYPVPLSGRVLQEPGRVLATDAYWNSTNLYRDAIGLHRHTGVFTTVAAGEVDVAHWTYPLPLRLKGAANVYTLHDLVPLRLPYTTSDRKRLYYRLCKRIARTADHIITVSEASRRDIIDLLGVSEDRVSNTWQTCDIDPLRDRADEGELALHLRGVFGLGLREYFLFFGAIEPKKNLSRILEGYLASGSRLPLVIVGAPGWGSEYEAKLLKSLTTLGNGRHVIWLNYLPRSMLLKLIQGARCTLFASLYEGFGLPILESMALGTPVITSNVSSMPEVAGDAALLVNPYATNEIRDAIRRIDSDEDLARHLTSAGMIRAEQFSAARYREALAALYRRLL